MFLNQIYFFSLFFLVYNTFVFGNKSLNAHAETSALSFDEPIKNLSVNSNMIGNVSNSSFSVNQENEMKNEKSEFHRNQTINIKQLMPSSGKIICVCIFAIIVIAVIVFLDNKTRMKLKNTDLN